MKYLVWLLLFVPTLALAAPSDDLRGHVTYLASDECQGRKSGTPGCDKAADYIKQQLVTFGYTPETQEFKKGQYNVLAVTKGSLEGVLVVGAHYDHMGSRSRSTYYGADDNASGVAAVLEMSRRMTTSRNTILWILFSGEEQGMVGSEYYVKHPKFPLTNTKFMVNLDMIGHLSSKRVRQGDIPGILKTLYAKYPFAQGITLRGGNDDSDNSPFRQAGIPFVFLHTGLTPEYHQPTDKADTLNYDGMAQILQYSLDLVKMLDTMDMPDYTIMGGSDGR